MPNDEDRSRAAAFSATDIVPVPSGGDRRGMVLVTAGADVGRAFRVEAGHPVSIGRAEGCTLVVDDSGLSRVHAEFNRIGDDYVVRDMDSTNGTYVNDQRVDYVVHLVEGDRIRIGTKTRLRFSLVDLAEESGLLHLHDATTHARNLLQEAGGERARPGGVGAPAPVVLEPAMRVVYEQAHRAAQAQISVLLLGETGVGKEVLARAIHMASPRAAKPFMALHCAALAESLLEAELFGHAKGAFTGAAQARPGLFEAAEGGTVFLDEVGELPMSIQVKLLRVLEQREVMRVGARTPTPIDVRFVSATNRDLEATAESGGFRPDLFFRINGIALTVPPLRERTREIPRLAEIFVLEASRQLRRPQPPAISAAVLEVLGRYAWPGNVRELRNVIERGVVLCSGDTLLPDHLPQKLVEARSLPPSRPATTSPPAGPASHAESLRSELDALEKQRILDELEACGGNQTHAAERLGMSRRTLVARLREWGLTRPRRSREP